MHRQRSSVTLLGFFVPRSVRCPASFAQLSRGSPFLDPQLITSLLYSSESYSKCYSEQSIPVHALAKISPSTKICPSICRVCVCHQSYTRDRRSGVESAADERADESVKHSQPPHCEQYRDKLLVYSALEYLVRCVVSEQGNVQGKAEVFPGTCDLVCDSAK